MLKLEKRGCDNQIYISLKSKEKLFNRQVCLAVAVALGLHLFGFLLFQVTPFKINASAAILPPVLVDAEISEQKNIVLANAEENPRSSSYFLEPTPSLPPLPQRTLSPLYRHLESIKDATFTSHPFLKLEKSLYEPTVFEAAELFSPSLIISGPLLTRAALAGPFPTFEAPHLKGKFSAVYQVQIEQKTGSIFWYEMKQSTLDGEADRLVEAIVKNLRFIPKEDIFVTSGDIEIHLDLKGTP